MIYHNLVVYYNLVENIRLHTKMLIILQRIINKKKITLHLTIFYQKTKKYHKNVTFFIISIAYVSSR